MLVSLVEQVAQLLMHGLVLVAVWQPWTLNTDLLVNFLPYKFLQFKDLGIHKHLFHLLQIGGFLRVIVDKLVEKVLVLLEQLWLALLNLFLVA